MSLYELLLGPLPSTLANHPECFTAPPTHPADRKRTLPMQVLSLGLVRTGTASLHAAFTALGYETYHGFHAFADARSYDLWNPAYETKYFSNPSPECPKLDREFFDKVLGHVSAVTDMPPVSFAEELIEAYPEAKIVLVEREEEAWFRSFEEIFITAYEDPLAPVVRWLDPRQFGKLNRCLRRGVAEGQFGAKDAREFRENARATYRKHYAGVRRLLRERGEEGRLLEFRLQDGWAPLCQFLGKEVPECEFPRVNESLMMAQKVRIMYMVSVRRFVGRGLRWLGPVVAIGAVAWYLS